MEIIAVANRLNHILSGQAEKFSALGLEAKTVTIYTDKDFNECNAPDKKTSSVWVELTIGTADMPEEERLYYCLSADFKPGGEKAVTIPTENEIAEIKDELGKVYERLSAAESCEEELKKISKENEEASIKMMEELNKKVKRSFIFLGVSVAALILIFALTLLI